MPKLNSPKEFDELRKRILSKRDKKKLGISISSGTCGRAYCSDRIANEFIREIKKHGLEEKIDFREVGCLGFCEREPLVIIFPENISKTISAISASFRLSCRIIFIRCSLNMVLFSFLF